MMKKWHNGIKYRIRECPINKVKAGSINFKQDFHFDSIFVSLESRGHAHYYRTTYISTTN